MVARRAVRPSARRPPFSNCGCRPWSPGWRSTRRVTTSTAWTFGSRDCTSIRSVNRMLFGSCRYVRCVIGRTVSVVIIVRSRPWMTRRNSNDWIVSMPSSRPYYHVSPIRRLRSDVPSCRPASQQQHHPTPCARIPICCKRYNGSSNTIPPPTIAKWPCNTYPSIVPRWNM